jgi:hypothetical protein
LITTGGGFETTNRSTGRFRRRRLFAAMSALKAGRFIVAVLPLWCRRTLGPSSSDDPPPTTENLQLFFSLYAETNLEALHPPKCIVNVLNWIIATNDNDGPAYRLGRWQPGDCFGASLPLTKKFLCVDPPETIITDDL